MNGAALISDARGRLAQTRWGRLLALRMRNQGQAILGHVFTDGNAFDVNGEAKLVAALAPGSRLFVDVGANVGHWSALFLEHEPAALGVCFEPGDAAMAQLRSRFGDDDRITLRQTAISDRVGRAVLHEEPLAGGMSSLVAGWSDAESVRSRDTEVSTLDVEMAGANIDVLKIDVEGYDLHALRGAAGLLADQRVGAIQFEYNQPWIAAGSTLSAALSLLEGHGYTVYVLKAAGLFDHGYSRWGEHFARSNYVAVAAHRHAQIAHLLQGPLV